MDSGSPEGKLYKAVNNLIEDDEVYLKADFLIPHVMGGIGYENRS